jgi:hypothetical protein
LDQDRNIAIMMTKPGTCKYSAFEASVSALEPDVHCFIATGVPQGHAVVLDDESMESDNSSATLEQGSAVKEEPERTKEVEFENHPSAPNVSIERDQPLEVRLHVRSGRLSFDKIRAMARQGEVPQRLAHCPSPMCAACQFGKATRKGWQTKSKNQRAIQMVTAPGQCVLVDKIKSRVVGFVTQLKGSNTAW